jgi:ferredoxin
MIELVRRLSGPLFPTDRERLPEIIEAVRNERRMKPEHNAFLGSLVGNFFHAMAEKQFPKMDNGYVAGEACAGCGQCGRICPRGNVHLLDGRPAWSHDCDFCGACATWCAQHAIGFKGMPASAPRKHHPSVAAADLIWA